MSVATAARRLIVVTVLLSSTQSADTSPQDDASIRVRTLVDRAMVDDGSSYPTAARDLLAMPPDALQRELSALAAVATSPERRLLLACLDWRVRRPAERVGAFSRIVPALRDVARGFAPQGGGKRHFILKTLALPDEIMAPGGGGRFALAELLLQGGCCIPYEEIGVEPRDGPRLGDWLPRAQALVTLGNLGVPEAIEICSRALYYGNLDDWRFVAAGRVAAESPHWAAGIAAIEDAAFRRAAEGGDSARALLACLARSPRAEAVAALRRVEAAGAQPGASDSLTVLSREATGLLALRPN